MTFPKYKEWMGVEKSSFEYIDGVGEFMKFARRNLSPRETIMLCPCAICKNTRVDTFENVKYHLVRKGIHLEYILWELHGETTTSPYVPSYYVMDEVHPVLNEQPQGFHMLGDLVEDVYENFHIRDEQVSPRTTSVNDDASFQPDSEYMRLKNEASRQLYPNCKAGHTTLYAMVGLHNIKSRFGLSGTSVSAILEWAKDLLPSDTLLPTGYPHMKRSLKGLGMKYKSIHACPFDCILYRKEHQHKIVCPICGTSRFVATNQDADIVGKKKRYTPIPRKVLKYFPIAPRLKRLYTIPRIAEAMTWHSRASSNKDIMRHPIDAPTWQAVDTNFPDFAKEARNVRLGMSTDGFNPHGALSTNQSIWPVIVVPYNLPPSMCMKKEFSILTLLIPGPRAPSDDIDVFLAPLVEDLNDLWVNGVNAFDSLNKEEFNLKAIMMWGIHDFPAYGTLSGAMTHGYFACPICSEGTKSEWLDHSKKVCYNCHRRFLPNDHKSRHELKHFLPEGKELGSAPLRLSGAEIESKASNVRECIRGKHPKTLKLNAKTKSNSDKVAWTRRSILFDLPYWKTHPVRHMLDVMHAEKNIVEHLVNTCLGTSTSKDGLKARQDLQLKKVKKELWITPEGHMPAASFLLDSADRKVFLDTLFELKLPSDLCSNLRRVVNYSTNDLRKCKSHDWHVIMQLLPLLFKHCFSKHKELRRAVFQISLCFSILCAKVVITKDLIAARSTLIEATCILEKHFPHSFFDISIHFLVHLCDEALLCGPVRYRWMYHFERLMKTYKDYVKQPRYICGSIAEEYIIEEASIYAREYMMPSTDDGEVDIVDEEPLGKATEFTLTNIQYEQVANYVFETHPEIQAWRREYDNLPQQQQNKRKRVAHPGTNFRMWVSNELMRNGDCTSKLARFAHGPMFTAKKYSKYRLNGFVFSSEDREQTNGSRQNSGISYKALTLCRASAKDKRFIECEIPYYGVVKDILVLNYMDLEVPVFYCDWNKSEDKTACKVDPSSKLIMVDMTKLKSTKSISDEPFVCTFQKLKQVYYSKDIKNPPWSIVNFSPQRLTKSVDMLEPPTVFQSPLDDNPALRELLVNYDV